MSLPGLVVVAHAGCVLTSSLDYFKGTVHRYSNDTPRLDMYPFLPNIDTVKKCYQEENLKKWRIHVDLFHIPKKRVNNIV